MHVDHELVEFVPMDKQDYEEVKALVWFWWIDETLSANLVYQVIMR